MTEEWDDIENPVIGKILDLDFVVNDHCRELENMVNELLGKIRLWQTIAEMFAEAETPAHLYRANASYDKAMREAVRGD